MLNLTNSPLELEGRTSVFSPKWTTFRSLSSETPPRSVFASSSAGASAVSSVAYAASSAGAASAAGDVAVPAQAESAPAVIASAIVKANNFFFINTSFVPKKRDSPTSYPFDV